MGNLIKNTFTTPPAPCTPLPKTSLGGSDHHCPLNIRPSHVILILDNWSKNQFHRDIGRSIIIPFTCHFINFQPDCVNSYRLKALVIGPYDSGKTSLMNRYFKGTHETCPMESHIFYEARKKEITIRPQNIFPLKLSEKSVVKITFWDSCHHFKPKYPPRSSYIAASLIFIVFDGNRVGSLLFEIKSIVDESQRAMNEIAARTVMGESTWHPCIPKKARIVLIANKMDLLIASKRNDADWLINELIKECQGVDIEFGGWVSALFGTNIDKVMYKQIDKSFKSWIFCDDCGMRFPSRCMSPIVQID